MAATATATWHTTRRTRGDRRERSEEAHTRRAQNTQQPHPQPQPPTRPLANEEQPERTVAVIERSMVKQRDSHSSNHNHSYAAVGVLHANEEKVAHTHDITQHPTQQERTASQRNL